MIQRIQSVFLLIIALCMISMLFVPIWVKGNPDTEEFVVLNAFKLVHENRAGLMTEILASKNVMYIAMLAIASAAVSIFSVFQYRNRLTQMKLGLLNSLVIAGLVVSALIVAGNADSFMPTYAKEFKIGALLPMIGLIFNSLANRFIRRDEKLVRDADRMR